jgi:hypothetical protein
LSPSINSRARCSVLVTTQLPMMMHSFGLSSTFKAMAVLRSRLLIPASRSLVSLSKRRLSRAGEAGIDLLADPAAILSHHG